MASVFVGPFSIFYEDEEMTASNTGPVYRGPDLYDFLVEAELQHYFNSLRASLKVHSVPQFKYVDEDDMRQIGMSKPEMRRLKKYFHKYCPQTYLRRIKKIILNKKEDGGRASLVHQECSAERQSMKVSSKHMIPVDSITINKELGSGEFGIVQQGVWTNEDGERIQVAIKRLSKEKMQNNSMDFLKEASIMHTIDTEHIVRLYGVVLETDSLMLVTELAPLRSLLECLKEPALRSSFPVISLCDFALQISDGMNYLENKRLIHRDLAARNILVFSKNKVKISDFGLSRALGVGKNYYQTNFNVNLKLPIAWCAAECINYLRFTSASDVWAYGVTLWEMFSFGFQPWAALTGQQILEAIDEPNFHRLEQPECCPKEFYILMLQCWQHDPSKRPKFSELMHLIPESKPEQVLTIKDYEDPPSCNPKNRRDFLIYRANEVITVLDDKPICDNPGLWKGVLNNGKTGLFNPANTVAYLGTEIPSMKQSFIRSDSKASLYSSRRRIRPDMISGPQGDLKHTSHVGLDGAFFGDVAFLGDKYSQLPKQVVAPYKPQDDQEHNALMRTASDVSDRAPLIGGKSRAVENAGADRHWSREEKGPGQSGACSAPVDVTVDHEYHEISEDEEGHDSASEYAKNGDSPNLEAYFQKLDFGPSLMDEVLTALASAHHDHEADDEAEQDASSIHEDETNNARNEIKEVRSRALAAAAAAAASTSTGTGSRKKQGTVKMISHSDAKAIDSAIAMANELATRNFEMDSRSESDAGAQDDSPRTPSSPNKRKFSFRFPGAKSSSSPRAEKRNFTEETASIPDIHDSTLLSDSAKLAYNSLVERRAEGEGATACSAQPVPPPLTPEEETNPLRMLRAGIPVRPKVRGNKHTPRTSTASPFTAAPPLSTYGVDTLPHPSRHLDGGDQEAYSSVPRIVAATLPRSTNGAVSRLSTRGLVAESSSHLPPPSFVAPTPSMDCSGGILVLEADIALAMGAHNPLPLPPRDRSRLMTAHKPRQRKHPLIIPTGSTRNLIKPGSMSATTSEANPVSPSISDGSPLSPLSPMSPIELNGQAASQEPPMFHITNNTHSDVFAESGTPAGAASIPSAPSKPPRLHSLDDSFDGQIQADMDSLDDIPEEEAPIPPPMYRNSDHVSCEDLLDFACDFPNAKRTQGRARGLDSDEVRIMQKVLKSEVTPDECVAALNETDWDVHKAIKYLKLQLVLSLHQISIDNCKQTLMSCSWDVQKAYNYLMVTFGIVEDSTEV